MGDWKDDCSLENLGDGQTLSEASDSLIWTAKRNGLFSMKSNIITYVQEMYITYMTDLIKNLCTGNCNILQWSWIRSWETKASYKVACFSWVPISLNNYREKPLLALPVCNSTVEVVFRRFWTKWFIWQTVKEAFWGWRGYKMKMELTDLEKYSTLSVLGVMEGKEVMMLPG